MKKRILSVLLALAMVFTLVPVTVFAAPTYQVVTVDKDTVQAGETVNVKVTLPNISETAGSFTVNLKFDTALFEVVSRALPPQLSAYNEGFSAAASVDIVANPPADANTSGELTANASYTYNTMKVAGVTVIDATLKAKASGVAAFSFSIFEITYSDNGTQYIVKKDQLETPPSVTISKAPISSVTIADLDAPIKGAAPDTSVTVTPSSLSADVKWFDGTTLVTGNFAANTAYTVKIKLTASGGDNFAGTVTAGDYTVTRNSETELLLTKTFGATGFGNALGGSVTIDKTSPKFGETLNAVTTALDYNGETAGTLSYQWYRGDTAIPSATGSSYTTVAADVGKTIKVEVKNSNNSDSVFSALTAAVAKANGPAAPTGLTASVTDTTITVTKNSAWQYSKDGGSNWQDSNVFTDLTPNTTYNQIVARVKETATHNAGAKSATISATTAMGSADTATITQLKATHTPYTGTYDGNSHNAFTVTALPSGWSVAGYSSTETGTYGTMTTVTNVADSGKIYVKFSHTSYADVIAEYTVTVNRAPLSIKAKDHTITYGDAPANNGVTISGYVNGETASNLAGTLSYDYSYAQYDNVGNYSITPKGYTSANYDITYKPGKLTVGQKEVGLTWAGDTGRVWGDGKTVTATATGMVNSDVINVTVTGGDATAVGSHTATATGLTGTKAGNYKLPVANTQTYNIGKATARTLADIPVSQKYSVTTGAKAIGTVMPADAGTLTYTKGAESKTGSVAIDSWNVDFTGKVTFTLSGGVAGDTVTLPVIIGSDNYENSTVNVVITLTAKENQAALKITGGETVVYGQTLQLGTSGGSGDGAVTYAVTNGTGEATIDATGKLTPVKVGIVKVKATKAGNADYNAITSAEVEITITQATPTGAPKYTAITTSGKTLAEAGLTTTGSNLSVPGTVKWVDDTTGADLPDTTTVEANKLYKWVFTPRDSANYTTLNGTIVLYRASTGIVIYSPCYTIKASAGANGTISPAGWCSVVENGSQTFTFTPDKGYTVAKVLVDGKSVGAVKSYTFKDVTKDHTIEVIFMKSNGNPATGVFVMP